MKKGIVPAPSMPMNIKGEPDLGEQK